MTTRITKTFTSCDEAGEYQHSLYDSYNYVSLVDFPLFTDAGEYVWEVRQPRKKIEVQP